MKSTPICCNWAIPLTNPELGVLNAVECYANNHSTSAPPRIREGHRRLIDAFPNRNADSGHLWRRFGCGRITKSNRVEKGGSSCDQQLACWELPASTGAVFVYKRPFSESVFRRTECLQRWVLSGGVPPYDTDGLIRKKSDGNRTAKKNSCGLMATNWRTLRKAQFGGRIL